MYFSDWDGPGEFVGDLDHPGVFAVFALTNRIEEILDHLSDAIQSDIQAFLSPATVFENQDDSLVSRTLSQLNSLLVKMSVFVYQGGKYVTMQESWDQMGKFYLGDAYVFLCIYKVEEEVQVLY